MRRVICEAKAGEGERTPEPLLSEPRASDGENEKVEGSAPSRGHSSGPARPGSGCTAATGCA